MKTGQTVLYTLRVGGTRIATIVGNDNGFLDLRIALNPEDGAKLGSPGATFLGVSGVKRDDSGKPGTWRRPKL